MATEGDPKIRRIAIVLQSMDADTVRKLLSQFPEEVARSIRRAFSNLGTVSPTERAAAAQELQSLLGKPATSRSDDGPAAQVLEQGKRIQDAIQFSPEARNLSAADHSSTPSSTSAILSESSPRTVGRSWMSIAPATLSQILQGERPSVVAAVLHELPVVMATSVLQLLPIPTASEAMAAMPHLHRNDPAVLDELLEQVWNKSQEAIRSEQKTHMGVEKLKAILAQAPEDQKYLWTTALGNIDPQLPTVLGWTHSAAGFEPNANTPAPSPATLRLHAFTEPDSEVPSSHKGSNTPDTVSIPPQPSIPTRHFQSLADLMKIGDADFVLVLHSVDPKTVLLALAGSERDFLKRVERLMPRKDLSRFRKRISHLSDVALREIDLAHEAILNQANNLYSEGRLSNGSFTSFTAAA